MKEIIKNIWRLLTPVRRTIIISLFLSVMASLLALLPPWFFKFIIDTFMQLGQGNFSLEQSGTYLSMIVIAWLLAEVIAQFIRNRSWKLRSRASMRAGSLLLTEAFSHLLRLSLEFHTTKKSGEIIRKIDRGSDNLDSVVNNTIARIVPGIASIIVVTAIVMFVEWRLALAMFTILPIIVFVRLREARRIRGVQRQVNKKWEKVYGYAYDAARNIGTVKANVGEKKELNRFRNWLERAVGGQIGIDDRWRRMSLIDGLLMRLGHLIVLGYGSYLALNQTITPGDLILFMGYVSMLYGPFMELTELYVRVQQQLEAVKRALDFLEKKITVQDSQSSKRLSNLTGDVCFENVSFRYPSKHVKVLQSLNLKVRRGEVVAFVGKSGVGKTTLINLLLRFYDPTSGRILIDGLDLKELKQDWWRKQVGVVLQDNELFNDSLRFNLTYGLQGINGNLPAALEKAHLVEVVKRLPDQLSTIVGEHGVRLSGGERQRVAIARTILKDPKILILDEATSSLDSYSEQQVKMALANLMRGRTTFIVAHRFATVRTANKIVVLENRSIVESGTHAQLMLKKGLYYELYTLQKEGYLV